MSLWPRSLFGRVALIVCSGLVLAHMLTLLIILRERGDQGLTMMLAYLGRDVAASVAILDRVTPSERQAWLPRIARQNYSYTLGEVQASTPAAGALAEPLRHAVSTALGASRVGVMMQTNQAGSMMLPLRLADGSPLSLQLTPPRPMISRTTVLLLALQLLALGIAIWLGVRQAVRPLTRMAAAANALKPGSGSAPLSEDGPVEVSQAAQAFNAMQSRIDGHLSERMQLLAAISHDLQTPITRMRLRTDALSDDTLRGKLQADLNGMQALVEEGLAYARTAQAPQETPRAIDLHALLDGLVCDANDAGHQVKLIGRHRPPLHTRVQALRRLMGNLIDNAIKFGGSAQVVVTTQADAVHITVLDKGPGIPPGELQAVLQPFYRVESSRNRETGGTGLGLAIAHQLALALSGELTLNNRLDGGLAAQLSLPLHP